MWSRVLKSLPYILLYGIALAVIGLVNVLTIEGQTDFWNNATFWNRTISQMIASVFTLTATIMLFLDKLRGEKEEYLSLKKTVEKAVLNDLDTDFGGWIFDENKRAKIKAFQDKVKRRIAKLERKASFEDNRIWYEGTLKEQMENKYCITRKALEASISTDRLDKLIMAIKIDYDKIDRTFVETGEVRANPKIRQKQDSVWRKVRDNAPGFMFAFAFTVFFNAFIYGVDEMNAAFWFRVAYSLGILLWVFVNGRMYAHGYMDRILIPDLNTRFNIIKDYLSWKFRKPKEVRNATES